jgi:hypothetical protein
VSAIPVVRLVRHSASMDWTKAERADLQRKLTERSTSIGELSDARESLGLARLSQMAFAWRSEVWLTVSAPEIQTAIQAVRDRRAYLLETLSSQPREAVREARRLLDLRRGTPDLRLGELEALLDQTRIVCLIAEGETLEAA